MNPTPLVIAALQAYVPTLSGGWAGNTNAALVTTLNTPSIANPTPQGYVPVPFVAADLVNACSTVANRPNLVPLLAGSAAALILAQAVGPLSAGLDALVAIGQLTSADATAMKAAMTQLHLDPSWPAQISWAEANASIGRPLDSSDIHAARPSS